MPERRDIDDILADWPYELRTVSARLVVASDGREVLQMRIDMGVLQMETTGRPDGAKPGGAETYLDFLIRESFHWGEPLELSELHLEEIDREFSQYYHRRICWLAVREFERAVADANHTLALMDFLGKCQPDDGRSEHDQQRAFVLFHRAQAAALAHLEKSGAEAAIEEINLGLEVLEDSLAVDGVENERDRMIGQLRQLQDWIRDHYQVGRTLAEQLADAVAAEEYERAAALRDELARRNTRA